MTRKQERSPQQESSALTQALATIEAEGLRGIIRDTMTLLDDRTHAMLTRMIMDRAARGQVRWTPAALKPSEVAAAISFAEAAKKVGYADPSDVDEFLGWANRAFLARDYQAARRIYHAFLLPIADVDIDLGQHEEVDEVLGGDTAKYKAEYVVSVYMTSSPDERAQVVYDAIGETESISVFFEPLRQMESAAVEPLPDFNAFLPRWRALVEEAARERQGFGWGMDVGQWAREVTLRMDGINGLATFARETRRGDDLRAWCEALIEAEDWKAALHACEEAAQIVSDGDFWKGCFLDDAALAAEKLGRKDLPQRLEKAWRTDPQILRLQRWLGTSGNKATLTTRVNEALVETRKTDHRQRALLYMLLGDLKSAAHLLASAPGLGWSMPSHPGHLLFPLFCRLLGRGKLGAELKRDTPLMYGPTMDVDMDIEGFGAAAPAHERPRLRVPSDEELLEKAGIAEAPRNSELAAAIIKAMRTATIKRIKGVTKNKRRNYYAHAARLAASCVAVDGSADARKWFEALRAEYRRYSALQREFEDVTPLLLA